MIREFYPVLFSRSGGTDISFIESGNSISSTMKVFSVGRSALNCWIQKRSNGESLKDPEPRRPWKKIDPERLKELVKLHADWYLNEFAKEIGVSSNSIWNAFKRRKTGRKKSPYATKKETLKSVRYFYSISNKYCQNT